MENHPGDTLGTRFLTFWGAILAFFGFALFAMLLQKCSSGVANDPRDSVRAENLIEIGEAGASDLEKLGWGDDRSAALKAGVATVKERKQSETKVVVPGTETAARLASEAAAAAKPPAEPGEEGEKKEGEDVAPDAAKPSTTTPESSSSTDTNDS